MSSYPAIVRPGQRYWIVEVPGVGFTQSRTLAQAGDMARDLIHTMTQQAEFEVTVELQLPATVRHHLDEAQRLHAQEARCRSDAAQETRAAAHELHRMGLALQQIGDALGVSRQRAHQLLNA